MKVIILVLFALSFSACSSKKVKTEDEQKDFERYYLFERAAHHDRYQ